MRHDEFKIWRKGANEKGMEFWMSQCKWRVTDVGKRTVAAINISAHDHPSWYIGPPYAVVEVVIDEDDMPVCFLTEEEDRENFEHEGWLSGVKA